MKVVAFLPARGMSESLPNKNLQIFCGEPLFLYTVRKLLTCDFIDEVYIDSENQEILDHSLSIGAKPLLRDKKLATKKTDGHKLLYHEAQQIKADIYVQILCTSPFIYPETIKNAINVLKEKPSIDSVVLVKKGRSYKWINGQPSYGYSHIPNKDDLEEEMTELMGLYVVRQDVALKKKRRFGDAIAFIDAKPIETIQVNTFDDFSLAKYVAAGIHSEESNYLHLIRTVLSSSVISDVCDEFNLNCVLSSEYSPNVPGVKIFGRARTLKIRESTPNDSPDAIYEALKSYKMIADNDVIVVTTECPELAYFGEINMSLAIRAGASGAIISGVTRDVSRTHAGQFPVFSKGRYCKDIKGKGAVAGINVPISIDGVNLNFGDLIFADGDGIVVIPRQYEQKIIKRALEMATAESRIIRDILMHMDIDDLVKIHGHF